MNLSVILNIIWFHWVADFVFQTDKMALNKSISNKWLGIHALIYSIPFIYFGLLFSLITFITHFITDYFTSRCTSKLWKAGDRHNFFVVIGLDQAIHLTTLLLTYNYLN